MLTDGACRDVNPVYILHGFPNKDNFSKLPHDHQRIEIAAQAPA